MCLCILWAYLYAKRTALDIVRLTEKLAIAKGLLLTRHSPHLSSGLAQGKDGGRRHG